MDTNRIKESDLNNDGAGVGKTGRKYSSVFNLLSYAVFDQGRNYKDLDKQINKWCAR